MNTVEFNSKIEKFMQSSIWKEEGHPFVIKHMLSDNGLQATYTPVELCKEIIAKLREFCPLGDAQILVLFNLEFVDTLMRVFKVDPKNITFFADSDLEKVAAKEWYGVDCPEQIITWNAENKKVVMPNIKKQFDVVVMNPPYQSPTDNKGSGHTLWDIFVKISIDELLKNSGYLCAVHPSGWRRPTGGFVPLGEKIRNKQVNFLSIHSIQEGIKTFGATTRYDWYILCNKNNTQKTKVRGEDGIVSDIDVKELPCVPNGNFDRIIKLFAKENEERVKVINDRSAYGADKDWVSEKETTKFKYPCIYSLPQKGIQIRWSSINTKGHFGISKVIFSNGAAPQLLIDKNGEYGLTQWAFGIVDKPENLPKIKKAMESEEFISLCKYMRFTLDRYDPNFIACLRKDFWKEFI